MGKEELPETHAFKCASGSSYKLYYKMLTLQNLHRILP